MQVLKIDRFLGLAQNTDFADLKLGEAYDIENLNCDIPLGKLTVRAGTEKKFSDAFTGLISIHEHKFPTSNQTRIIVNDSGTLKVWDGAAWSALTMPTIYGASAEIDTSFVNQYFGRDDYVLVTTGNGSKNYVLWYGYLDRDATANKGIFGDIESFTGYKLTRAQLIPLTGMFSNIKSVTKYGDYYYITVNGSKFIEKRDSNYRLVTRLDLFPDIDSVDYIVVHANATRLIAIVNGANDATKDGVYVFKPDSGFEQEAFANESNLTDVFADTNYIYITASTGAGGGFIKKYNIDLSTVVDSVTAIDFLAIEGNSQSSATVIYAIRSTNTLELRQVSSLGTVTYSYSTLNEPIDLYYNGTYIYVSDKTNDYVKELSGVDLTLNNTYSNLNKPTYFVDGDVYVISSDEGTLRNFKSVNSTAEYPLFISINTISSSTGGKLSTGYYYYKYSVVDQDGNEFAISDPVVMKLSTGSEKINLKIIALDDQLDDYYRLSHINIYRAYSSVDSEVPDTEYMFLKKIDINDYKWVKNSGYGIYYYSFTDNYDTSTVTYYENSGISDNVKPRFVNGKYLVWDGTKLHLANVHVDGKTYINIIVRSGTLQPANIAFYDYYNYGSGGLEIIGLAYWMNRVIAFKKNTMGIFYDGALETEYILGVSSERGFTTMPAGIFFANDKGIYFYNGGEPERINDAVQTVYNNQTSFSDLTVFYFDYNDRLIISKDNNWSIVFNLRQKVWTKYDSYMAWKVYYKTLDNEFLCFGSKDLSQAIWKIVEGTKDMVEAGLGGTEITVKYESGLIKPGRFEGMATLIFQVNPRFKFSGTNLSLTMYKYTDAGRTSILASTLTTPAGSYVYYKSLYVDNGFGESFSILIEGSVTDLEFSDLTIVFDKIGMLPNE